MAAFLSLPGGVYATTRDAPATVKLTIAACLGLCSLAWLPVLPGKGVLLALTAAGLVCLLQARWHVLAVLLLGGCWACWQAQQLYHVIPPEHINQPVKLVGQVVGLPVQLQDLQRFVLEVGAPEWLAGKRIRISWYRTEQTVHSGQKWRFIGKIKPLHAVVNPHGFDAARWLLAQRISGSLAVQQAELLSAAPAGYALDHRRAQLLAWIQHTLPADQAAIASALSVGQRGLIGPAQRDILLRTGTGHLLAISGLHIGMAALFGWWLGQLLTVAWSALRSGLDDGLGDGLGYDLANCDGCWPGAEGIRLLMMLLVAIGYAAISGLMVSTGRALVMLLLAAAAMLMRRRISPARVLLAALLMLLLYNPMVTLGAGFWLSFGAVFWLWWSLHGRLSQGRWWQRLMVIQVVLLLGMSPLQLVWFQQFSLLALPANLFAIPLVSGLILPLLLLAVLLHSMALPGADMLLRAGGELLHYLHIVLAWLAGFEFSAVSLTPSDQPASLLLALVGGAWLLLPRGWPLRWIGLLLMLPLCFPGKIRPAHGHWEMQVFDVGQGLAVAIRTRGHVLVYDTGPGDGLGRDLVQAALVPVLRRWNWARVDRLIISHGDLDHAGGYATALAELRVAASFSSKTRLGQPCHAGHSWHWDGVDFTLLHPGEFLPYLGNDSSCVLLVSSAQGRLLLPGDISKAVEQRLLNRFGGPPADVLVVAHHGSKSSSGAAWLAAVAPQLAVISAGRWNRFDMPHAQTTAALAGQGVAVLNTAECGALRVRTRVDRPPLVTASRWRQRRWWQAPWHCQINPMFMQ